MSRRTPSWPSGWRGWRSRPRPGIRTRLERLERATAGVRCVRLYVGWSGRPGVAGAGDGVSRVFVPVRPETLAPGLMALLRHPGGAEVGAAAAARALTQLARGPRRRALTVRARILVLITAGASGPPPAAAADGAAPPGAAAGSPPAADQGPVQPLPTEINPARSKTNGTRSPVP
jgi:hypothetical protein